MNTIYLKDKLSGEEENFDLASYRFSGRKNEARIASLFPSLPRNTKNIPFDIFDYKMLFADRETNELIRAGKTIGCFYIESPGMRSLLKRLSVRNFEMLTAASSVIRPGVAESGMMQEFIARHKNPKLRKYLVPELEKYLGETYGVMIYQEDVIKVAHHVAGLSLEEADLLRRAMSGKLRSHTAMQKVKDRFFESAVRKGYAEKIVSELWRQIESFAGYAFCKAHSASFALLSYQVAFLKTHYPAEFMASALSNGGGYYSAAVYVQECKRLGLKILLPSINESLYEYAGKADEVRIGLMAIKKFSKKSAETIVGERKQNGKYMSLPDFLVRTEIRYEETAILIKCGAADCLGLTRPSLMRLLDVYIHRQKIFDNRLPNLFAFESFQLEQKVITDIDYTIEEKCKIEFETFDFMITKHPLELFNIDFDGKKIIPSAQMDSFDKKYVKMIGWYMTSKRIRTRKGDIMKFLSLEDLSGTFEAIIFPKVYSSVAEKTLSMGPYFLEGFVDAEGGNNLVVKKLETLSALEMKDKLQKDSVDHNYHGDKEKIDLEEFAIVESLNQDVMRQAYAG